MTRQLATFVLTKFNDFWIIALVDLRNLIKRYISVKSIFNIRINSSSSSSPPEFRPTFDELARALARSQARHDKSSNHTRRVIDYYQAADRYYIAQAAVLSFLNMLYF